MIVDMRGPELRMGPLSRPVTLTAGETVILGPGGLPVEPEAIPPEALRQVLAYDKKRNGGTLTVVLCRKMGESFLHPMEKSEFSRWACGE